MFVLLKDMYFMEALWKEHYAGLFDDSSVLKDLSMFESSRYTRGLYSVERPSGPMGIVSFNFLMTCNIAVSFSSDI